jgi:hypothetical protein
MILKALLALVLFSSTNFGATLRVPQDMPSIQQALEAGAPGDTVRVGPGIWQESLDFGGRRRVLLGSGTETCILQGQGQRLVRFTSGEDAGSELSGFRIQQGHADTGSLPAGGGVLVQHASPRIHGNLFVECSALSGGGLALLHSNSIVENNRFEGNTAFQGGGIHVLGGSPLIRFNRLEGNTGGLRGYGGGIALEQTAAAVHNNVFDGNGAFLGGGISCRLSPQALVEHNTLYGNASRLGGGVYLAGASGTLAGNVVSTTHEGGAAGAELEADPGFACNLHYGNLGGNTLPGQDLGGNRAQNPLFCDPGAGDFRLEPTSPCYTADCGVIGYTEVDCAGVSVDEPDGRPSSFSCLAGSSHLSLKRKVPKETFSQPLLPPPPVRPCGRTGWGPASTAGSVSTLVRIRLRRIRRGTIDFWVQDISRVPWFPG